MAVSSLNKMTTPLPAGQSASTQGLLMPKLKYRFRVTFENFGVSTPRTELTKQVVTCGRPNPTFEEVVIHVYNSQVKLLGKPSWGDITCTLRDDATGSVSKLVGEQLQKQFDFQEQASAASGIDYKFTMKIETLDGGNGAFEPTVLETWELYGVAVAGSNYGDNDYASSDPNTIELSLRFDNAVQTPGGTGVGTNVGRTLGTATTG